MMIKKNAYILYIMVAVFGFGLFVQTGALAANDPSIKGIQRKSIIASMERFLETNTTDDKFYVFDAVKGKLLHLEFKKLHDGIVKKGFFYVSCADFVDQNGRVVDIDFMVIQDGTNYKTTQAIVHSVDGQKRKYHLE